MQKLWKSAIISPHSFRLVGVGYRATNQGQKLDLALGFSHNILIELPQEIKLETINEKGKNPIIKLTQILCRPLEKLDNL